MNATVKNSYTLLYNQLWLAADDRVQQLNPGYIMPVPPPAKEMQQPPLIAKATELPALLSTLTEKLVTRMPPVARVPESIPTASVAKIPAQVNLTLNWDQLVDKVNNCTLCALCDGRKNVVIERGSRNAKWMFVGEGPGEDEDIQGKPFVGKSGQLLDKMILAMKLDKDTDVYVCNVVKCRPPYNRNPEPQEIASCKNYLLSQIELVKPQIIITLGRFASQTLLESALAIGKLRNQVHKFNTIPLIVTYHPDYLLRNPGAKKEAWDDLQLALKVYS